MRREVVWMKLPSRADSLASRASRPPTRIVTMGLQHAVERAVSNLPASSHSVGLSMR